MYARILLEIEGIPWDINVIDIGRNRSIHQFNRHYIGQGASQRIAEMVRVRIIQIISITTIDHNRRVASCFFDFALVFH